MNIVTIFISLEEICLIKYGNPKAYTNPNVVNALKEQSLTNVRKMYNVTDIESFEQYMTENDDIFFKITIKTN